MNWKVKETILFLNHWKYIKEVTAFFIGMSNDFDVNYAIDTKCFWHFLENTQNKELVKLQRSSDWKIKILDLLDKRIKKYGILEILRKGLKVDEANFTFFYEAQISSSSQSVVDNFEKNEFSITRQVHYNKSNLLESIDMVLFINGLPIATLELKNIATGQTAKDQGIKQYKYDRDISQPLLNFGRCLVHFALDTDEVYMCTKLNGANSFFLSFNKGNNNGKGNPPNPYGHKSSYLWQEIFTRESLANIIQHFVRFDGKSNDALFTRNLYFPRYHQLDVVRRLLDHTSRNGIGQTYLIQHSAGSGKSNSITWLAFQLIEVYPVSSNLNSQSTSINPLFDSVIVVTDRRLLDKQLSDNIKEFSEEKILLQEQKVPANLECI